MWSSNQGITSLYLTVKKIMLPSTKDLLTEDLLQGFSDIYFHEVFSYFKTNSRFLTDMIQLYRLTQAK